MVSGMFNSTTLDVITGLIFVYLLLAIMCTTINEWLAGIMKARSSNLASGIKQLLDAQPDASGNTNAFLQEFYKHPLISSMLTPGKSGADGHPNYLPARTFATAVMDIATPSRQGAITYKDLQDGLTALPDGDVKTALLALIQNAHGDLGQAQKNIESWFDDTMDRVSGWYKRRTQQITVVIAIVLTLAANADTVAIARKLWQNPTQRAALVEEAKNGAQQGGTKVTNEDINTRLGGVLGWGAEATKDITTGKDLTPGQWIERGLGWILTMIAVSLGAPFWFDMLNKVVNIRNAGNKPDPSDTQPKPGTTTPGLDVQVATTDVKKT
jgi:hypothetical protein